MNPSQLPEHKEQVQPGNASFIQVAKAVFFSFLGVRKREDYESDSAKIKPIQVIVAGIVGAMILVVGLLYLVSVVTK